MTFSKYLCNLVVVISASVWNPSFIYRLLVQFTNMLRHDTLDLEGHSILRTSVKQSGRDGESAGWQFCADRRSAIRSISAVPSLRPHDNRQTVQHQVLRICSAPGLTFNWTRLKRVGLNLIFLVLIVMEEKNVAPPPRCFFFFQFRINQGLWSFKNTIKHHKARLYPTKYKPNQLTPIYSLSHTRYILTHV